ncbi:TatD DNase [Nowakowskiella sp. JEL0407]|nr:TatD DNase [Nowakowskiella sp. JEL0407]
MSLIDIGVNLTDPMFSGIYREKVVHPPDLLHIINRAITKNVDKMIITGGSLSESKAAIALSTSHSSLYATVGCHPTRCNEFLENPDKYFTDLKDLVMGEHGVKAEAGNRKIVAIGECGLDYDRLEFCDKDTQKRYFLKQFELAEASRLPMFLHNRNTDGDFVAMVRENRHRFTNGVSHSFTGTIEEAKELIDLNIHIGLNGCSLKTDENLEVVKQIPAEFIMLETDAPWCDIRPTHASHKYLRQPLDVWKKKYVEGELYKGRNEPSQMRRVLEAVAGIKGMDIDELAAIVYKNTSRVFFPV